jgi:hypothetical protein
MTQMENPESRGKKKKVAVLVLCHAQPELIGKLVSSFDAECFDFFIHVDKKSDLGQDMVAGENVHLLPEGRRVDVKWGCISVVDATLALLREAVKKEDYFYYWLVSGQDLLIKKSRDLYDFLVRNGNQNYLTLFAEERAPFFRKRVEIYYFAWMASRHLVCKIIRNMVVALSGGKYRTFRVFRRRYCRGRDFFFGHQWFCFSGEMVAHLFRFLADQPAYHEFMRHSFVPDETYFATILLNSPLASTRKDGLTYVDWSANGKRHPKTLDENDLPALLNAPCFAARKFALPDSKKLIAELENRL